MQTLQETAHAAADLLKKGGQTVSVCESAAGGLISAALVAVPGASAYYVGGAVVYTHDARRGLLGITDADMAGMRASTEPYALLGAQKMRTLLNTTWAIAETGASGPTGNRYGDAAGHACIAVAGPIERTITLETGDIDREANMQAFAEAALKLLADATASSG